MRELLVKVKNEITQALVGLYGFYTRPDRSRVPAIWIGEPPLEYQVEGVEIIIKEGGTKYTPLISGGRRAMAGYGVDVTVVQHGTGSLLDIKDRLVRSLIPLYWNIDVYPMPETQLTLEQLNIEIRVSELVDL